MRSTYRAASRRQILRGSIESASWKAEMVRVARELEENRRAVAEAPWNQNEGWTDETIAAFEADLAE